MNDEDLKLVDARITEILDKNSGDAPQLSHYHYQFHWDSQSRVTISAPNNGCRPASNSHWDALQANISSQASNNAGHLPSGSASSGMRVQDLQDTYNMTYEAILRDQIRLMDASQYRLPNGYVSYQPGTTIPSAAINGTVSSQNLFNEYADIVRYPPPTPTQQPTIIRQSLINRFSRIWNRE